jgi:hypothetical protein
MYCIVGYLYDIIRAAANWGKPNIRVTRGHLDQASGNRVVIYWPPACFKTKLRHYLG